MKNIKLKNRTFCIEDSTFDLVLSILIQNPRITYLDITMESIAPKSDLSREQYFEITNLIVDIIAGVTGEFVCSATPEIQEKWNSETGSRLNSKSYLLKYFFKLKEYDKVDKILEDILEETLSFREFISNNYADKEQTI